MKKEMKFTKVIMAVLLLCLAGCNSVNGNNETDDIDIAYKKALQEEWDNYEGVGDTLFYGYGYVNEDDIPELFVIHGQAHTDKVRIYTYDADTKKAICIGKFGETGSCRYAPYENRIVSTSGGQGSFLTLVFSINKDDEVKVTDYFYSNTAWEVPFYYGFELVEKDGVYGFKDKESLENYGISNTVAEAIYTRIDKDTIEINIKDVCTNKYPSK